MTSLSDCILLMLECIPFTGMMQRHQHLARELSRYLPVIYVEETPSRIRRILDGQPFDPALSAYRLGLRNEGDNLRIFRAPPYTPRSIGYRRSVESSAKRTAEKLKQLLPSGKKIITWFFSPAGLGSVGLYGEIFSVFDCYDAFGEFPGEERFKRDIRAAMAALASAVDLVITTHPELKNRLIPYNANIEIVQNGCDPDHFISGGRAPSPDNMRIDLELYPHPVIGYMGDIAPWMHLDFLLEPAKKHRDWTFVLLGTWKREQPLPEGYPNIHAPGFIEYQELPYYAKMFDVGTIPFEISELTRVVNPLKLYEYFALGMPVVSSPLPEVALHKDLVYIASTPEEFALQIEKAVNEPIDLPVRSKRIEIALSNSWKARGEVIRDMIQQCLKGK